MFPLARYVELYEQGRALLTQGDCIGALERAAVGRDVATEAGDRYTAIFFALTAARRALDLVDLKRAEDALLDALQVPLDDHAPDAIAGWSITGQSFEHMTDLRAQALYTLGRYQAACGALLTAVAVLRRAWELLGSQRSPYLSTGELSLLLAECLLDAGELDELELIMQHALADPRSIEGPVLAVKWQMLRATCLHMRGALSQANESFQSIAMESPKLRARALWQQANVLAALNRMDDCQAVLAELKQLPELSIHCELLDALIQSRRAIPLDLSPSLKKLLTLAGSETPEIATGETTTGSDSEGLFLVRRTERTRDEWTQRAQAILLALYQEDWATALLAFARLDRWVRGIDSALIHARHDHLAALVTCSAGDADEAELRAKRAYEAYASRLRMPDEERAALRMMCLLAERRTSSIQSALRQEEQRLLKSVRAQLRPGDDVMYCMNKPTALDDALSMSCAALDALAADSARPDRRQEQACLVEQILSLRRWHTQARLENPLADIPADEARDVYAWVHQHLRQRVPSRTEQWGSYQIEPRWLPTDAVLAVYLALPETLVVLLLTRSGWQSLRRSCTRVQLRELVQKTLRCLKRHSLWPGSRTQETALRELSEALLVEKIQKIAGPECRQLYICPDDAVVHVPWAALRLGADPLVARLTPILVPHALWTGRRLRTSLRHGAGIAVPRTRIRQNSGAPYNTLPDAEDEVRSLPGLILIEEPSRARVLAALQRARYAHFAGHGEFSINTPLESGLLLEREILRISDLTQVQLDNLDLVVLNACWSGGMQMLPGHEFLGFPQALLDSGVGTVILSQWEVNSTRDGQTCQPLLRTLYRYLGQLTPADALTEAQRHMVEKLPIKLWATYVAYQSGIVPRWPLRPLLRLKKYLPHWLFF